MSQNPGAARLAIEVEAADAIVEATEDDAKHEKQDADRPRGRRRRDERRRALLRARAATVVAGLVVLIVVLLLPIAAASLLGQLRTTDVVPAYDALTGKALDPTRQDIAPLDATYANFDISDIDEAKRTATIIVSGNRLCQAICPPVAMTISSMSAPGSLTRGTPPSTEFDVPGKTGPISFTLTLPVAGDPQRYPFDNYTLLFGIAGRATAPNGTTISVTKDRLAMTTEMTISSSVGRLGMAPPVALDAARMTPAEDATPYLSVLQLSFTRPAYLQVLTVLLVLLITASGFFALFMRELSDLSLGIGGIILGVWGIRSVVIQGNLPAVTLVDTLLALVILVLLLGLAIRATLHFWRQAAAARRP
ncbi:MAG TPA: hypothetical protein VFQ80_08630 [Thermomicrobiales bacterium]|jgi:hypothetical protein|nr:hypothetical protein [Thermomicrobiales bacterium]